MIKGLKSILILFNFLMIIASLSVQAQSGTKTGFIIRKLLKPYDESVNFFLVAQVDSTLNLIDNLTHVQDTTLLKINLRKNLLPEGVIIYNEFNNMTFNIIAVKVTFSTWSIIDDFLPKEDFSKYPILVYGHQISSGYNMRETFSFRQLKILTLEKQN